MSSCTNVLATTGALVTSVGTGVLAYTAYNLSQDSVIGTTARICGTVMESAPLSNSYVNTRVDA